MRRRRSSSSSPRCADYALPRVPIIGSMTHQVLHRLGPMTVTRFMREAWQRKPLLLRGALAGFRTAGRSRPPACPRCSSGGGSASDRAGQWRLEAALRTVYAAAFSTAPGLDAAGAGRRPAGRRRAPAAAALPLRSRCPTRRSDDELRDRRRRRGSAHRFLRCIPVAGGRSPPLAHQPATRPAAGRRPAVADPRELPAHRRNSCWSLATCSTCRPASRTKARPSASASRIRSAFAPRPTRNCSNPS